MKTTQTFLILSIIALMTFQNATAQSFKKGVILVSLTEGSTDATYTTTGIYGSIANDGYHTHISGDRDPLTLEYGLGKHIGLGITLGSDIFSINAVDFYNPSLHNGNVANDNTISVGSKVYNQLTNVKTTSSDVTLDFNYHYLITKHFDLAIFTSFGPSSVIISGDGYNYTSNGCIGRIGSKARYYICKRFGLVWMLSAFSTNNTPDANKSNFGSNYKTGLTGLTSEIGLNFRFF